MSWRLPIGMMAGRGGAAPLPTNAPWMDEDWSNRVPLTVTNSNGTALSGYQVNAVLSSGFDFASCLSDGADIRITDSDGVTVIPYWIESFDVGGTSGSVWARIPTLPAGGKVLYLYYGNAGATVFDVPPLGPFVKNSANPVIPSSTNLGVLPENTVFDPATSRYYTCYADREGAYAKLGMAYTTDFVTWTDVGVVLDNGGATFTEAPSLHLDGGTWYCFFSNTNIYYATASGPEGTWTVNGTPVLVPVSSTWEASRVTEPHVIKVGSTYYLTYMADEGLVANVCNGVAGNNQESIGFATAPAITGPYTKYAGNPVIPYTTNGDYESCIVADQWAYLHSDGHYYLGYAGTGTPVAPAHTAIAVTDDFITYKKWGVRFGRSSQGISVNTWDDNQIFRGALIRVSDTYHLMYTGLNARGTGRFQGGHASMSAKSTATGYPPQQVFDAFENFATDGALPNGTMRANVLAGTYATNPTPSTPTTTVATSGVATFGSGKGAMSQRPYAAILTQQHGSPGSVVEARAKMTNAGSGTDYAYAIGFGDDSATADFSPSWIAGGGPDSSAVYSQISNRTSIRIAAASAINMSGNTGTSTPITVECWVYLKENLQTSQYLVAKHSGWAFILSGSSTHAGRIQVFFNGATVMQAAANSITSADLNTWTHLAFSYSTDGASGTTRIWKNGVEQTVTGGPFNANMTTTNALFIGQRGDQAWWPNARIAQVRISDNVRYTVGFTPSTTLTADGNTKGLWMLNEGAGDTAFDTSGNSNHGTIYATGRWGQVTSASQSKGAAIRAHGNANFLKGTWNRVATESAMATAVDTSYHTFKVWWADASTMKFQIDNNGWESLTTTLPGGSLPAYMEVNARNDNVVTNGALEVDWLRLRQLAASAPVVTVGSEQAP